MAIGPGLENPQCVRFGIYEADLSAGELRRSGVRVRVQIQPFKVLAVLLERPGAVVTREELQERLWGASTTVDYDHGLGNAVNKLREALGDSADNPRFIETLARRGYRFIAPVTVLSAVAAPEAAGETHQTVDPPAAPRALALPAQQTAQKRARLGARTLVVLGLVLLLAAASVLFFLRGPRQKLYPETQVTFSGRVLTNSIEVQNLSVTAADSARVYFVNMDNGTPILSEALIGSGEMRSLFTRQDLAAPLILSISPDGSSLLVRNHQLPSSDEPIWIVSTLDGEARRVPNVEGHDGTWMPDGKHILIAREHFLDISGTDGSDLHTVATLPEPAFWPRWSPNGKSLRYTSWNLEHRTTSIWEMTADFQKPHPVFPKWSNPASECCGSWTADGTNFVFQSSHSGHSEIWKLRENPWYLRDSEPQQVTSGPLDFQAPTGAVQGRKIFFVGVNPQIELMESSAAGTDFSLLEQNLKSASYAVYSSDGKWVAWLNSADGSLWRSRADGSERMQLLPYPAAVFRMEWSPDDRQLALMAKMPGGPWKVYLMDANGGQPKTLVDSQFQQADPTWTPDGKTIVFGELPDRMETERRQKFIFEIDLRTRAVRKIEGSEGLFSPRLSPDGRFIAAMRQGQRELLVMDRQNGRWKTLTTHGVGDPVWSRDGKAIYFQDFLEPGKPIYKIDVATGKLEHICTVNSLKTIPVTDYRFISLAPGDRLIVSAWTSLVNIYSIDLD